MGSQRSPSPLPRGLIPSLTLDIRGHQVLTLRATWHVLSNTTNYLFGKTYWVAYTMVETCQVSTCPAGDTRLGYLPLVLVVKYPIQTAESTGESLPHGYRTLCVWVELFFYVIGNVRHEIGNGRLVAVRLKRSDVMLSTYVMLSMPYDKGNARNNNDKHICIALFPASGS